MLNTRVGAFFVKKNYDSLYHCKLKTKIISKKIIICNIHDHKQKVFVNWLFRISNILIIDFLPIKNNN